MWKDRLKRLLILLLVAVLFFFVGKVFANWLTNKNKVAGASISLPTQQIGEKISDFGESVLGKTLEIIPGGNDLKEKLIPTSTPTPTSDQNTSETIIQTKEVETKTQEIIQIIKELPAAELDNIKKQVFKDFCQKILEE